MYTPEAMVHRQVHHLVSVVGNRSLEAYRGNDSDTHPIRVRPKDLRYWELVQPGEEPGAARNVVVAERRPQGWYLPGIGFTVGEDLFRGARAYRRLFQLMGSHPIDPAQVDRVLMDHPDLLLELE